jgi:hypothetical protein
MAPGQLSRKQPCELLNGQAKFDMSQMGYNVGRCESSRVKMSVLRHPKKEDPHQTDPYLESEECLYDQPSGVQGQVLLHD